MSAPQVSVTLTTRNRWPMLEQALDSALGQEGVELEVIVIDEASSDETPERLRAIDDERVVLLRNDEPKGPGGARNAAAGRARGEWIAFLDDDDILAPECCRAQLRRTDAATVLAYPSRVEVDDTLAVWHLTRAADSADLAREMLRQNMIGGPSGVLVRAAAFDEVGGFDETFSALADWDLWVRLTEVGPAAASPEPLLAYRRHPQNMMVTNVAEVDEEFVRLRHKHAAAAAAADVEFGEAWLGRWRASRALGEGRRAAAARAYVKQAMAYRSRRDLVRAVAALGGERVERLGRTVEGRATHRPEWLNRYA